MNSYVQSLIDKYETKGLLVDANLSLLHLVGSYNVRLIGDGKYNKLSKYTLEDYRILLRLMKVFKKAVTTPHVLTEVSNLTGDLPEQTRVGCLRTFYANFVGVEELTVDSFNAALRPDFAFVGLTDCVLAQFSNSYLIVSDDGRLIARMNNSGLEALNFNHLREHLFPTEGSSKFGSRHSN